MGNGEMVKELGGLDWENKNEIELGMNINDKKQMTRQDFKLKITS